uniref:Uncharacterized protein n=1 Tax=Arundo donax TaxID=35708 RepID=A0A0A8ZF94_ARUDO
MDGMEEFVTTHGRGAPAPALLRVGNRGRRRRLTIKVVGSEASRNNQIPASI